MRPVPIEKVFIDIEGIRTEEFHNTPMKIWCFRSNLQFHLSPSLHNQNLAHCNWCAKIAELSFHFSTPNCGVPATIALCFRVVVTMGCDVA
jgi:hypothetical protein